MLTTSNWEDKKQKVEKFHSEEAWVDAARLIVQEMNAFVRKPACGAVTRSLVAERKIPPSGMAQFEDPTGFATGIMASGKVSQADLELLAELYYYHAVSLQNLGALERASEEFEAADQLVDGKVERYTTAANEAHDLMQEEEERRREEKRQ